MIPYRQGRRGSRFHVQVKLFDPSPERISEIAHPTLLHKAKVKASNKLCGMSVLLAEDAPDNQVLIERFLKMAGATAVTTVSNGKDAEEQALSGNYNVVLMDIQMPVMDRLTAVKKLRERGYTKPIIALSAYAMKEDVDKSMKAGCDDHVSKPVEYPKLIEKVMRFRN